MVASESLFCSSMDCIFLGERNFWRRKRILVELADGRFLLLQPNISFAEVVEGTLIQLGFSNDRRVNSYKKVDKIRPYEFKRLDVGGWFLVGEDETLIRVFPTLRLRFTAGRLGPGTFETNSGGLIRGITLAPDERPWTGPRNTEG